MFGAALIIALTKELIDYSFFEQIVDILPCLLCSAIMGAVVYALGLLQLPSIWLLLIQVFAGIIIYAVLAILFKLEAMQIVLNFIKSIFKKKQDKNGKEQQS